LLEFAVVEGWNSERELGRVCPYEIGNTAASANAWAIATPGSFLQIIAITWIRFENSNPYFSSGL
jgi:hypothetical protein